MIVPPARKLEMVPYWILIVVDIMPAGWRTGTPINLVILVKKDVSKFVA
jgi:hypothetical protein